VAAEVVAWTWGFGGWLLLSIQLEAPMRSSLHGALQSIGLSLAVSTVVADPSVLTNLTQGSLEAAIKLGQPVTFTVDGAIQLTNTVVITSDATLDASERTISLNANSLFRHFVVTSGATLRLVNLTLANGRFVGANGGVNQNGLPGFGGSILGAGANLQLIGCQFTNNSTLGGNGGTSIAPTGATFASTDGASAYGGAVYVANGSLVATNCLFANNSAAGGHGQSANIYTAPGWDAFGGAVYSTNSATTLVGVTFTNNAVRAGDCFGGRAAAGGGRSWGGAFASESGTAVIRDCVLSYNQAVGSTQSGYGIGTTGSANGGALFLKAGSLQVESSFLSANTAIGGGGIARDAGEISAYGNGGAVFVQSGTLELRDSTLAFNLASGGDALRDPAFSSTAGSGAGGCIWTGGTLDMVNCTLTQNTARGGGTSVSSWFPIYGGYGYGGAIAIGDRGVLRLLNSTVAGNSALPSNPPGGAQGYGSSIWLQSGKASASVTNVILACAASQTNISGTISDGGHNLCSDASAALTMSTSRNSIDPMLGPLADNGGPTPTLALLPGSPAIDAGDDSVAPAVDQRGIARPQGLASDIGAFELTPKFTLTHDAAGVTWLDCSFPASRTNSISASTNLTDWIPLGTIVSDPSGSFRFQDPDRSPYGHRFDRLQTVR
jgi:hypothetical protein